jgi:ribosomal protein S12 methylthiotransferase accessory factor
LPTGYCYSPYPSPTGRDYYWADPNGHAAGYTLEEAILHGLLELIERDSVTLWWYSRSQRPAIDLDSFAEPYVQALRQHYRERHRDLWVLDLTSDLGIPVFAAVARRTDQPEEQLTLGYGAHLDPCIGVLRALTELNQLGALLWGAYATSPRDTRWQWWQTVTLAHHPYLAPDVSTPPRTRADYGRLWGDDVREDVRRCQASVEEQGLEVLVLDQTRPDTGLPVVQVIVPGLRHFRPPRLAPGRLYDVPLKLGWLREPLAEDQLNPDPLF